MSTRERPDVVHKSFLTGKVPPEYLSRIVYRHLGAPNRRLILGSALGEDAAIVRVGRKTLVLTTDPITGARENAGWLSVHINANDIATRGAKPVWFLCCLLLPEQSSPDLLERIMKQVDEAAREISVTVVGGHSEITPGLNRPIVVGSMLGEVTFGSYVTTSGAKPGDKVILTKTIGLEGTAVLAHDLGDRLTRLVGEDVVERAKLFSRRISVVRDAEIAKRAGRIDAMHDPTEGGILCGLWELAEASGTGILVQQSEIAIAPETKSVCSALGVDPFGLLSSGALLIAARPRSVDRIVKSLRRRDLAASVIGEMTPLEKGRTLVRNDGVRVKLELPARDEVYRVLDESGTRFG